MRLYRPGASTQLTGFSGSCVKGFYSLQEAQDAWEHACASRSVVLPKLNPHFLSPSPSSTAFSRSPTPSRSQSSPSSTNTRWSSTRSSVSPSPASLKNMIPYSARFIPPKPPPTYSLAQLRRRNAQDKVAQALAEIVAAQNKCPTSTAYTRI